MFRLFLSWVVSDCNAEYVKKDYYVRWALPGQLAKTVIKYYFAGSINLVLISIHQKNILSDNTQTNIKSLMVS